MSASTIPTAAQLAEKRRALGISQRVLAELIRSGRVTIARYETGADRIPERRALQIAATLETLEMGYRAARAVAGEAGQQ